MLPRGMQAALEVLGAEEVLVAEEVLGADGQLNDMPPFSATVCPVM
jgi:hypothetical protein